MHIALIEPFYSGSHKKWADGLKKFSEHTYSFLTLPGRHWKWRMHGGAVTLAESFLGMKEKPDLILATDMLDLATFLALTRDKSADIPVAVYFHENQLTYPWSPQDRDTRKNRDHHYVFINYTTALAADRVFFNSDYHLESFLKALPAFLRQFPDKKGLKNVELIRGKSSVLNLGLNLKKFDRYRSDKKDDSPVILWNHRWEYDKKPGIFFGTLIRLKKEGHSFRLIVLGEQNEMYPDIFDEVREILEKDIIHWGYVNEFEDYAEMLWKSDILPVTSIQDFFGGSVVEAMYCNTYPLLPNRLAYPEHIPPEFRDQMLYLGEKELYQRLKSILENPDNMRQTNTNAFVKKYDWRHSIRDYDITFKSMLQ